MASASGATIDYWLNDHPEVDSVYACVCDLNGILRGKRIPASDAGKISKGELRLPLSVINVDVWGADIENSVLVYEQGDADGLCEATGRGSVPITWNHRLSAMALLWMGLEDGTPFSGDPRRALASVLERYSKLGLTPVVATEMEFYLCDSSAHPPQPPLSPVSGKRLDNVGVLSIDELQHFGAFLDDLYDACALQGIPADAAIAENGAGQFEVNMKHVADPLRAADDALLFKQLVRGIARKHGFLGSFMAKPYGDRSVSYTHLTLPTTPYV